MSLFTTKFGKGYFAGFFFFSFYQLALNDNVPNMVRNMLYLNDLERATNFERNQLRNLRKLVNASKISHNAAFQCEMCFTNSKAYYFINNPRASRGFLHCGPRHFEKPCCKDGAKYLLSQRVSKFQFFFVDKFAF